MPAITAEELELAIDIFLALGQPDVVPQVQRQQVDAARVFHHFLEENNEDQVAAMNRYVELTAEGRREEDVAAGDAAHRFARAVLAYIPWLNGHHGNEEIEWVPHQLPWYQRQLLMPMREAFRAVALATSGCCSALISFC